MSSLPISFACAPYDRMVPLLSGEVRPAGIDLNFIQVASPRETFDRINDGGSRYSKNRQVYSIR